MANTEPTPAADMDEDNNDKDDETTKGALAQRLKKYRQVRGKRNSPLLQKATGPN